MMSMQSSDVMECETSASEASGNVSSADTSTWSTYLLGRIARRNVAMIVVVASDGGVGGDGAPGRRQPYTFRDVVPSYKTDWQGVPKGRFNGILYEKRVEVCGERNASVQFDLNFGDGRKTVAKSGPVRGNKYADTASAIALLLQHNELLVRAAATSGIADRTFESEEDAMGNPMGRQRETRWLQTRMILRSQAKNRVCEDLYVRIGTFLRSRSRERSASKSVSRGSAEETAQMRVIENIEPRGAAQYAALWLNGNAFSCTTDAIGFSRLSAGSTTSLMQPVLRRHWRAATVSPPIYEANTPGRLYSR
ncbi:hypothetical protein ALC56_15165 [Trachymyrmex septentrionalis]|uniref:Uncharacterized protein n=1 Tax=Trachymyrmex septentrionalis TaxID=34720 RepID=A0A195ERG5_9HYME|nr:hypothetical protein ALC56_15165 [Trachymyrmex septentrionalis]